MPDSKQAAPPWPRLRILELDSLEEGDELISLKDASRLKRLGRLNGGRKPAWQRLRRWATKGVKVPQADGSLLAVQLPVIRIGTVLHTTEQALISFMEHLTDPDAPEATVAQIRQQQAAAEQELDRIGI